MTSEPLPARPVRPLWVRIAVAAPLLVFAVLCGLLLYRLFSGDPSAVPSALIGRPVPEFTLPALEGLERDGTQVPGLDAADLRNGAVSVVNVWASWCAPCRDEHPLLTDLARDDRFRLYGINYKDAGENARRFLGRYGNPFDAVGVDANGRVGIDWGVYGVPETFVVGGDGTILYKHIGQITPQSLRERLIPEIEKALAASAPPAGS
jgi:cytochrome c biogenesis protein CcmG/thiol:disulfide interchange protein DsbE